MKLKFRAEKKDIITFAWACLLLLFVVALCVVNLYNSSNKASMGFTFNIIPAFFPPYIGYTLIFWLIAILLIIASVSSHFFEREKGFGFSEGKDEKGFGRFAKEYEYKKFRDVEPVELKAKEATAGGFPLLYDKKKGIGYVDNGESHSLVIGATGSGKTTMIVNPLVSFLAKKGESMVISDPKGEIFEKNAEMLKQMGYKVIVVNFRDPQNGSCWNPYTLPYKYYKSGNTDKANELLNDMAINIAADENTDDPFWTNSAADYLTGLSLGMFEDASEEEVSISTVNLMMTVGDEKLGGSTYLKEYFKGKDPASPAAINALGTINAPQDTKNSIDSVLKQKIKVFAVTQNLSEMLSRSDFDMEDIGKEKTAVFMIIQDEKTTYHALATIFVKQCYESLISVAQKSGGALPVRTNFILDEFANMPKFKDITTMITAARSRHIRMTMIIQNFAQLVQTYGKEDAETIRGNCGNMLYLLTGELAALEEISKLCGDKIVKVGKDKKEETRPLITVPELQRFKQDEVLILKHRLPPLRAKFLPFYNNDFGHGPNNKDIVKATLPTHEKKDIKLFDIREYVKKKKEEQRNDIGAFGAINPMGGSMPLQSPFDPSFAPVQNPFSKPQQMPSSMAAPMTSPGIMPMSTQSEDDLDINDLISKLDAKIAELEAEETKEIENKKNEDLASEKFMVEEDKATPEIPTLPKIDFSTVKLPVEEDIIDDFLEDLSDDDDDIKEIKEEPKQEEKPSEHKVENKVYTNKEEIDKIMEQKNKADDDLFDEFFE